MPKIVLPGSRTDPHPEKSAPLFLRLKTPSKSPTAGSCGGNVLFDLFRPAMRCRWRSGGRNRCKRDSFAVIERADDRACGQTFSSFSCFRDVVDVEPALISLGAGNRRWSSVSRRDQNSITCRGLEPPPGQASPPRSPGILSAGGLSNDVGLHWTVDAVNLFTLAPKFREDASYKQ